MAKSEVNWSVLRGALIVLTVTLVLGGALVGGGYYFREEMRSLYEKEQRRFLSLSRRYLDVDEEERLIQTYLPKFRSLEERGIAGDERRLNWDETLRRISTRLRLPSLRYQLEPRHPYNPPYDLQTGVYQVYMSRMRVFAGLLHEGDLFRLFDELDKHALGRYTVDSCSITRSSGQGVQRDPSRPNLNAQCELLWLTIRQPTGELAG